MGDPSVPPSYEDAISSNEKADINVQGYSVPVAAPIEVHATPLSHSMPPAQLQNQQQQYVSQGRPPPPLQLSSEVTGIPIAYGDRVDPIVLQEMVRDGFSVDKFMLCMVDYHFVKQNRGDVIMMIEGVSPGGQPSVEILAKMFHDMSAAHNTQTAEDEKYIGSTLAKMIACAYAAVVCWSCTACTSCCCMCYLENEWNQEREAFSSEEGKRMRYCNVYFRALGLQGILADIQGVPKGADISR
jgi:hypothetical protein